MATLDITLTEPDLLEVTADGTDVKCFEGMDGRVSALVQGGTAPYAYLWDTNPPRTSADIDSLVKGTYTVSIIDANGCEASDAASIDHPPLLEVSLVDFVDPFCDWPNGSIEVTVTGGISPIYTYAWNTAPILTEPAISNLLEGGYYVVVTDENGCFDTLSVKLTNTPPAVPFFVTEPSYENPILESDAQILFLNMSQGAIAYDWDFGDGMGRANDENPIYTYLEPGQYPVTLTAYNRYLVCPVDTTFILNIIPDGALYFANAFTPNGDNFNDVFYFKGEGIVAVDAHIYNRWGQEMAVINNVEDGWDGTFQGKPVPEGVYMYVVKAEFNDGSVVERGGSITVIR
jgi:gliding motility-associated-like protein